MSLWDKLISCLHMMQSLFINLVVNTSFPYLTSTVLITLPKNKTEVSCLSLKWIEETLKLNRKGIHVLRFISLKGLFWFLGWHGQKGLS